MARAQFAWYGIWYFVFTRKSVQLLETARRPFLFSNRGPRPLSHSSKTRVTKLDAGAALLRINLP
jgi:hypothetical protein